MRRGLVVLIAIVVVVGLMGMSWVSTYNQIVGLDETVKQTLGDVQAQYQRRADLIPNLVSTVKGYAAHERETLEAVTNARASVGKIDLSNANEETLRRFQQAQGQLTGALSRLLVVAERYPDLKANQNFQDLQSQLEGTENRISVARQRYNEAVREFNTRVRQFFPRIVAGTMGMEARPSFAADEAAQQAPKVQF